MRTKCYKTAYSNTMSEGSCKDPEHIALKGAHIIDLLFCASSSDRPCGRPRERLLRKLGHCQFLSFSTNSFLCVTSQCTWKILRLKRWIWWVKDKGEVIGVPRNLSLIHFLQDNFDDTSLCLMATGHVTAIINKVVIGFCHKYFPWTQFSQRLMGS